MKTAKGSKLIGFFIKFILFVIVAVIIVLGTKPEPGVDISIYDKISPICTNFEAGAVDEAALFLGGPSGPVPTLLLYADGLVYGSTKGLGQGWNPTSIKDAKRPGMNDW